MFIRTINVLLLLTALAGMAMTLRQYPRYQELRDQHKSLSKLVGNLSIDDPEKIYIAGWKMDMEKKNFSWHMHLPAKTNLISQLSLRLSRQMLASLFPYAIRMQLLLMSPTLQRRCARHQVVASELCHARLLQPTT